MFDAETLVDGIVFVNNVNIRVCFCEVSGPFFCYLYMFRHVVRIDRFMPDCKPVIQREERRVENHRQINQRTQRRSYNDELIFPSPIQICGPSCEKPAFNCFSFVRFGHDVPRKTFVELPSWEFSEGLGQRSAEFYRRAIFQRMCWRIVKGRRRQHRHQIGQVEKVRCGRAAESSHFDRFSHPNTPARLPDF